MKNEMMVFEGKAVEIFELNGQILFNPRHVAVCLDISESTLRDHLVEMNGKQVVKLTNESIVGNTDFRKLHNTGENFLTESGVYKLIFKYRKPDAERFQNWVTDEVLPSIRKTGSYSMKDAKKPEAPIDMAPKTAKAFRAYMSLISALSRSRTAGLFTTLSWLRRSLIKIIKTSYDQYKILNALRILLSAILRSVNIKTQRAEDYPCTK